MYRLTVRKDILDHHIELSQEVFAEAISIPANGLKQHTLDAIDWQVEGYIPFGVEVLADGRGRLLGVSKIDYKVLLTASSDAQSRIRSRLAPTGSLLPLLSFAAKFLACLIVSRQIGGAIGRLLTLNTFVLSTRPFNSMGDRPGLVGLLSG